MLIAQGNFGLDKIQEASKALLKNSDPNTAFNVAYANISNFLLAVATIVAVIYAILAGIKILGAFGNEQQITSAKNTLLWLAIGLAVIGFAVKLIILVATFVNTGHL